MTGGGAGDRATIEPGPWAFDVSLESNGVKRCDAAVISTWIAHALAWIVALWLAVGPVYQGVSATAVIPGDVANEPTRFTETLIEANGLRVLLWVSVVLLLGFCAVGIASIGLLYLPAAVALVVLAVTGSWRTLVRGR